MTLHEICAASVHTRCLACGASDDQPCRCEVPGVHYARLARAFRVGYVSRADFAGAIHDDVFSGLGVLLDPGAAA